MRFLETEGVEYEASVYEGEFESGLKSALAQGHDPEATFKTLVARGKSGAYYVFCIPVGEELDLKAAAKSVGEKNAELIPVKDILAVTGYVRGGCSPLAAKKAYPVYIDETAILYDTIYVSAGLRGVQLELDPNDLQKATQGVFADLIR